jgi:hypothetical protein
MSAIHEQEENRPMEQGTMECPICGVSEPHQHSGQTGGDRVAVDARVERLAHALGAAQQNIMAFPSGDAAAAFRRLSPRVRSEMWANADALLAELARMEESTRLRSE